MDKQIEDAKENMITLLKEHQRALAFRIENARRKINAWAANQKIWKQETKEVMRLINLLNGNYVESKTHSENSEGAIVPNGVEGGVLKTWEQETEEITKLFDLLDEDCVESKDSSGDSEEASTPNDKE